ncbi:MAG: energy transducer TonB [Candidatus Obscuribacterales bacterium]|nr:energy transducer TonB [Candidatus Obscuribacterales bacterium]
MSSFRKSEVTWVRFGSALTPCVLSVLICSSCCEFAFASDWDEDGPKKVQPKVESADQNKDASSSSAPLQGKIEKVGEASLRIRRGDPSKPLSSIDPHMDSSDKLDGKAIDDELRGMAKDGSLSPRSPLNDALNNALQGKASLQDPRLKGTSSMDPDADDAELLVEWDRWHNRFLRAVQLGMQELLNNPDPEDYERPRVDPYTGAISTRYPLGTGAAFSCLVTAEGQIKNLEIIEASGFPKYDRAVLRAVQQLAGTQIIHFPKGSHRRTCVQPGRIKTSTNSDFKYHKFGDVERVQQGR